MHIRMHIHILIHIHINLYDIFTHSHLLARAYARPALSLLQREILPLYESRHVCMSHATYE